MRPIQEIGSGNAVALAAAAAALGLPPASFGIVPATWNRSGSVVPELELEVWSTGALSVTAAVLYGGRLHPFVYADQTITGSAAANTLTKSAHGLLTGDGPFDLTNAGGALPGGLSPSVPIWAIKVDANTFKAALSLSDALAGVFIDLTTDGTGTSTIHDRADTQRVYWETHDGLLGLAGDGAFDLTASAGYSKRVPHSPRVVAYALVGTLSTGTVSAAIYPIQDRD